MDRTADPCKDFFQFACGTWNKKHLIPEDRSSISTFEVLADQQQVILKGRDMFNFFEVFNFFSFYFMDQPFIVGLYNLLHYIT